MSSIYDVAELVRLMGKVEGRKRLQKIVYLLQQKGFPFEEEFEYGFFGPYSRELSSEIVELVNEELLHESTEATMEGDRYVYSPTEQLRNLLDSHPEYPNLREDALKPLLCAIASENTPTLEIASSLIFLSKSGYAGERLIDKVRAWKPKLYAFIPGARSLLDQLDLIIE